MGCKALVCWSSLVVLVPACNNENGSGLKTFQSQGSDRWPEKKRGSVGVGNEDKLCFVPRAYFVLCASCLVPTLNSSTKPVPHIHHFFPNSSAQEDGETSCNMCFCLHTAVKCVFACTRLLNVFLPAHGCDMCFCLHMAVTHQSDCNHLGARSRLPCVQALYIHIHTGQWGRWAAYCHQGDGPKGKELIIFKKCARVKVLCWASKIIYLLNSYFLTFLLSSFWPTLVHTNEHFVLATFSSSLRLVSEADY